MQINTEFLKNALVGVSVCVALAAPAAYYFSTTTPQEREQHHKAEMKQRKNFIEERYAHIFSDCTDEANNTASDYNQHHRAVYANCLKRSQLIPPFMINRQLPHPN